MNTAFCIRVPVRTHDAVQVCHAGRCGGARCRPSLPACAHVPRYCAHRQCRGRGGGPPPSGTPSGLRTRVQRQRTPARDSVAACAAPRLHRGPVSIHTHTHTQVGCVAWPEMEEPPISLVRCVRSDLAATARVYEAPLWQGISSDNQFWVGSIWLVDSPLSTFLANKSSSRPPAMPRVPRYYCVLLGFTVTKLFVLGTLPGYASEKNYASSMIISLRAWQALMWDKDRHAKASGILRESLKMTERKTDAWPSGSMHQGKAFKLAS
eukprot:1158533-Pelagomonas_calceolata.AAC.1